MLYNEKKEIKSKGCMDCRDITRQADEVILLINEDNSDDIQSSITDQLIAQHQKQNIEDFLNQDNDYHKHLDNEDELDQIYNTVFINGSNITINHVQNNITQILNQSTNSENVIKVQVSHIEKERSDLELDKSYDKCVGSILIISGNALLFLGILTTFVTLALAAVVVSVGMVYLFSGTYILNNSDPKTYVENPNCNRCKDWNITQQLTT